MQLCHSLLLIAPCCLKNVNTLWPLKSLQMLPDPHVWSGPLPFPSMPECSCHLHVMASCLLYLCSFCFLPLEYFCTPLHLPKFYPSFKTQLPYHFLCKLPPYLSSFCPPSSHPFIRVPTALGHSLTVHFTFLPFFSARLNSSHLYSLASPQDLVWTAGSGKGGGTQRTCVMIQCVMDKCDGPHDNKPSGIPSDCPNDPNFRKISYC